MNICIYGPGAIGGYLAVCLAEAGHDVSVVACGEHLEAIRKQGLTLVVDGDRRVARVRASDDPAELGAQDYVITAVKAHSLPAIADRLPLLFHEQTAVVTAVDGIPWWYFHGLDGPYVGASLNAVDPGSVLWDLIGPERAIGCVVHAACTLVQPGVIRHVEGDRFILGEPEGGYSKRAQILADALCAGGLRASVEARVRDEIWSKLWGDLGFNPISAITRETLDRICSDVEVRGVARTMMLEARAIGEAIGVHFASDVDQRLSRAESAGVCKTSMLRALECGRPIEIDATVTAVQELGRMTGHTTPTIDTVLAFTRFCGREAGCYAPPPSPLHGACADMPRLHASNG